MSSTTTISLKRIGQLARHLAILQFADMMPQDITLSGSISDLLQGGATKEEASSIMKEILESAVQYSVQTFNETERVPPTITESPSDERIGQLYTKIAADRLQFKTAEGLAGIIGHFKNAGADDAEVTEIVSFIAAAAVESTISEADSAKA